MNGDVAQPLEAERFAEGEDPGVGDDYLTIARRSMGKEAFRDRRCIRRCGRRTERPLTEFPDGVRDPDARDPHGGSTCWWRPLFGQDGAVVMPRM